MDNQRKLVFLIINKSSSSHHFLRKSLHHFSTAPPRLARLTSKTCIQLLKNCKSMIELKQIQTQLFRICIHQKDDVLKKLMVVCADPSQGNLRYAQKIFDYIIETPSLFIYNVMIKAYVKTNCYKKAIFLFDELRFYGLWPDNFTYPFVC